MYIYIERERWEGDLLMLGRVIRRVRLGSVRPCLVKDFSDAFFHVHQQQNPYLYSRSKTLKRMKLLVKHSSASSTLVAAKSNSKTKITTAIKEKETTWSLVIALQRIGRSIREERKRRTRQFTWVFF